MPGAIDEEEPINSIYYFSALLFSTHFYHSPSDPVAHGYDFNILLPYPHSTFSPFCTSPP